MAVFKVNKNNNYTVISNTHLKERKMTLKAKGLLTVMLSLPPDWDYSLSGLVSICKENEFAIKTTLKELKLFGYLKVNMLKPNETKSGRIEYVYDIFENPLPKNKRQEVKKQKKQQGGFQPTVKQPTDIQSLEKQGQLNTNTLSTKESNTNILNTYLLLQKWNNIANECNLKAIKSTTKIREKKMQKLLKKFSEEEILKTLEKVKTIKFLHGQNSINWKLSFDDFLNEDKFVKIMEGSYYDKNKRTSSKEAGKTIEKNYDLW